MTNDTAIGIHDLSFATTEFMLAHTELAAHNGTDIGKYHIGIGQESMSVPAADEDIVTMAAAAAAPLIARHGTDQIRTVVFATESSIDQAKSAGVYVHSLLQLPSSARVVELKQACYGATAGVQFAIGLIRRDPSQRVLVIASDVSKYDLDSPGEATQGAAAVAMLITANPALVRIEDPSGLYSADVMDFWRPNYRDTALVDGKDSINAYLQALEGAWKDYTEQGGRPLGDFTAFCYHQPFTKMAYKAHRHLLTINSQDTTPEAINHGIQHTTTYNTVIGNSYTASLYLALASLLDHADDLTGKTIALLSYGSGSVAEFFAATITPGYHHHLRTTTHHHAITRRKPLTYTRYRQLHQNTLPTNGSDHPLPPETTGPYRLTALSQHKRIYQTR